MAEKTQLDLILDKLDVMQAEQNKLSSMLADFRGSYFEATLRAKVGEDRGKGWAKRFQCRSLFDLMKLIPGLKIDEDSKQTYEERLKAAKTITTLLLVRVLKMKFRSFCSGNIRSISGALCFKTPTEIRGSSFGSRHISNCSGYNTIIEKFDSVRSVQGCKPN